MKTYRVFFERGGFRLTKVVQAESLHEVFAMFKGINVIDVREIDMDSTESEIIL